MSHRRKEKDIKKGAAESLIDSGVCFFRSENCDKNYDCNHCSKVPGFSTNIGTYNPSQLRRNLKKARSIKKLANFKDHPPIIATSPPPPTPSSEPKN